jgi:membrane-bound metal-dependent hydrolase YbcI (DUF457 family)
MANHKQHTMFSTISGIVFSGLAWFPCGFPAITCLLAGGLCSVGGMVPDIDVKTSRSFQDCMSLTACFASMLIISRVSQAGVGMELMSIIGVLVFLLIKFGVGRLIQQFTVHRGIIHSIPFAFFCGEIIYLLADGNTASRFLKAVGLTLGFFSHLLLDEIYSFKMSEGTMRIKKSFGTALKFFQIKTLPLYIVLYLLLIVMTYTAIKHPTAVSEMFDKQLDRFADMSIKSVQHFEKISSQTQQQIRNNTNVSQYEAFTLVEKLAEHDRVLNEQRLQNPESQNETTTEIHKTAEMFANDDLLSNSLISPIGVNSNPDNPLRNSRNNPLNNLSVDSFDNNRIAATPNRLYKTSANDSDVNSINPSTINNTSVANNSALFNRQRSPQNISAEIPALLAGLSTSPVLSSLSNSSMNPQINSSVNPPTNLPQSNSQPSTWYFPPVAPMTGTAVNSNPRHSVQ